MTKPIDDDAVAFHSTIAADFDERYESSRKFHDRRAVWSLAIEAVGHRRFAVDLGCGSGQLTELLLATSDRVLGIDGSPEMIDLCRRGTESSVEYLCARFDALDMDMLRDADLLIASSVLEYTAHPVELLESISTALAPDAVVLVSIPNRRSIYRLVERLAFALFKRPTYLWHVRSRPKPEELAGKGYEVRSVRHLSPAPIVGRAARRFGLGAWFDTLILVEIRPTP